MPGPTHLSHSELPFEGPVHSYCIIYRGRVARVARVACSPGGREVSVLLPGVEQSASVCRLLKRAIDVAFNSEVCKYDSFRNTHNK